MKTRILLATIFLMSVATLSFVPSAFAATYSGNGSASRGLWFTTWWWNSYTTVDTSQNTLTASATYPSAWSQGWNGLTFLSGVVVIHDSQRTITLGWIVGQDHGIGSGYSGWSYSMPYSNRNTGMVVNAIFYYGGASIFGGPSFAQVQIQYSFSVGS